MLTMTMRVLGSFPEMCCAASVPLHRLKPVLPRVAGVEHRGSLRCEKLPAQHDDAIAVLVAAAGFNMHDAADGLAGGFPFIENFGFRVERIARKQRLLESDEIVAEVCDGFAAGVAHAHADREAEDQSIDHGAPPERLPLREMFVDEERVLIHRQQREPGVVVLRDGAARPMFVDGSNVEFFVITAEVVHRYSSRYFSIRRFAMMRRCSSFVPPPITTSGASR